MYILDTNILSELMKPSISTSVEMWVSSQSRSHLFVTTVTQAEILYGIALLPPGARQQKLSNLAQDMFREDFAEKILPFCPISAGHFATIAADRRKQGQPISQFDAQIAAICRTHRATIVTRNVDDFTNCKLETINPWEE